MTLQEKSKCGVLHRVQWLLELMGHVHNIATGTYTLARSGAKLNEVLLSTVLFAWVKNVIVSYYDWSMLLSLDNTREWYAVS